MLQVVSVQKSERVAYAHLSRDARVDSVSLADLRCDDPRRALISHLGVSAKTVVPPQSGSDIPATGVDDGSGVQRAVPHLGLLGHRWIGHISGTEGYVPRRSLPRGMACRTHRRRSAGRPGRSR
ncbi:hypothetical protein ACXZ65_17395 [Streptomyces aculeolatus]